MEIMPKNRLASIRGWLGWLEGVQVPVEVISGEGWCISVGVLASATGAAVWFGSG